MRNGHKPVVTHVISGDLWAGAEVQVYNLCLALQTSEQVTVTAVLFNAGVLYERLIALGIPVTVADEKKLGPWAMTLTIARHCKQHRSGVLHTHGFKENVLGIIGKELSRVPASVRTVHGNPEITLSISKPHKWLVNRLDVLMGKTRQQAVIAVSSQLEQKLKSDFPGKVRKIFNFIDVDSLRAAWGFREPAGASRLQFGIVGRLVPVKRVDLFIETIALLNERGVACDGIVLGSGPMAESLRALASRRGVTDRIVFRGFVNPALPELKKLDGLVMTSDHEGLPMTLLEALALEVPVVAHSAGGIPEVLSKGACGWLVDDHSPSGYADALQKLIASPEEASEKTRAGLETVRQLFDRPSQTEKYLEIYRELS